MPTYDYRCGACGHAFELFQSMTESPKRKCPKCGKNALERLIGTGAAVLFKGSGFYQTDYRSESYKKAADAEKAPAGAGGAGDAAKSDGSAAKPAAGDKPVKAAAPDAGNSAGAAKTKDESPRKKDGDGRKPKRRRSS